MKIHYHCDQCGRSIDSLDMNVLDESKLGFDILSAEERRQMLYHDPVTGCLHVQSICDSCIDTLGVHVDAHIIAAAANRLLH